MADLTALSALSLADNAFSGTVPPEIGSLDQLQYLYLEDNRLSGPLPLELGDLDLVVSGENAGGLRLCRNSFTSSQNLADYLDQFHDGCWQDCQSFEGTGIFWDDFEKGLVWSTP